LIRVKGASTTDTLKLAMEMSRRVQEQTLSIVNQQIAQVQQEVRQQEIKI
jgi:hypothetical protein